MSADSENSLTVPEKQTANETSLPDSQLKLGEENEAKSSQPQLLTFPDGGREAWIASTT